MAVAAQLMRRIMVDHARERHALKRGGGAIRVTLDETALVTEKRSEELLALDEALEKLAEFDRRRCRDRRNALLRRTDRRRDGRCP